MSARRVGLESERGAELVEFALVFPLLLLVVLGIIDFGFLFQRMEVVTNAAREGARIRVLPGYSDTDAQSRACTYLQSGGVPITGRCPTPTNPVISVNSNFSIDIGGGKTIQGVQVQVSYSSSYFFLSPLLRFFGGSLSSVPINGVAVMRSETPAPSP